MAEFEGGEKMQFVVDSLRANPDIVVVGGHEANYLESGEWPTPRGYWSRTLDIYTHPANPIYDADALNDFMYNLVPEIEPTTSDRARGGIKNGVFGIGGHREALSIGTLYYDEVIGTAALTATVQLKDGLSVVKSGALDQAWETSKTLALKQRTWVRVYPDLGHVIDAAQGHNKHSIPAEDLGRRNTDVTVAPSLADSPTLGGEIIEARVVEAEERTSRALNR